MPPRVQYNYKEKVWWSERFQESHFTGTDAKRRFYNHAKAEIDNKAGDLYEKCKGKRYKLPPFNNFRKCLHTKQAATIVDKKESISKRDRKGQFPELDSLIVDFVDRSESFLSQYGIGLSWLVVKEKAI